MPLFCFKTLLELQTSYRVMGNMSPGPSSHATTLGSFLRGPPHEVMPHSRT